MSNGFNRDLQCFVLGALVGGVVAVMVTPHSGSRMRRIVRHKIEDGSDQIGESLTSLRDSCEDLFTRTEKFLHEAGKKVTRAARA